ncbi:hypothetical protein JHK82_024481 [Glycine max]|uniref:Uncharacterized protein n=1 Tax=Glycine max TaxID=3847 RepID=K7KYR7_SOYBN|nr:hypothetical protein JHK87_024463 [Glycine soja]KAG5006534.1 hypothetical protein JHK85_025076 [Glycine max]KAG5012317.1 hypothetical protein JHK86_024578 [Glycine max]KAG5133293.1 hypothetical protein JHK82_024481 [Glycine max]
MKFLFKGIIATGFAAYAPSKDSRQYEGFNIKTEETNDSIDDNTDMEVNEPEIDTTTQNMSLAKESGQRKRGCLHHYHQMTHHYHQMTLHLTMTITLRRTKC